MTDAGTTTASSQPLRMTGAVVVMALVVLFLLAGAIPVHQGAQAAVFTTPVFIVLLVLLGASVIACCIRRGFSLRHLGFHMAHAGVVCILAGAAVGFIAGRAADVTVPVVAGHAISRLLCRDGTAIPLDFSIGATRFVAESYDPDYHLFRPAGGTDDPGFEFAGTVRAGGDGSFAVSPGSRVRAAELRTGSNEWVQQHVLDNGWFLQKAVAIPRHFQATLRFADESSPTREAELSVNRPVTHHGWRFFLMSYQEEPNLRIVLTARKDPGRRAVIAGIYALMAGTGMLCFSRTRSSHAGA